MLKFLDNDMYQFLIDAAPAYVVLGRLANPIVPFAALP